MQIDFDPTVFGNGVWMGLSSAAFFIACWLLRLPGLHCRVRSAFAWSRLTSASVFVHRMWWNLGLALDPVHTAGDYHPFFTNNKDGLLVLIAAMCVGTYKTFAPFIEREVQIVLFGFGGWVLGWGLFWVLLVDR